MSSNRTKFMELKEGINIGRVKNIWYYSRSRWSRNTIEDLLMKQNYFIPHKVTVFEGENVPVPFVDQIPVLAPPLMEPFITVFALFAQTV